MVERVLTLRELNRALLARQLLLQRARLPVARAIERLGALQAQWSPAPYVALWTRLEGFSIPQLERALAGKRVVKATLMRSTRHPSQLRGGSVVACRSRSAITSRSTGNNRSILGRRASTIAAANTG